MFFFCSIYCINTSLGDCRCYDFDRQSAAIIGRFLCRRKGDYLRYPSATLCAPTVSPTFTCFLSLQAAKPGVAEGERIEQLLLLQDCLMKLQEYEVGFLGWYVVCPPPPPYTAAATPGLSDETTGI